MPTLEPLGALFNIAGSPSTRHIWLKDATAVSFISYADVGTQTATFKESIDGASEQALSVIDTIWKAPGTGGTWTKVTQAASDSYTHADAVNDCIWITVLASQLSDGFNAVEVTHTGTTFAHALLHGLSYPQKATQLPIMEAS